MPVEHTVETLRPLRLEPLSGAPSFVLGVSIIRGAPVPVLDARALLGAPGGAPGRLLVVRAGERRVALGVDEVLGVHALHADGLAALPPLLDGAGGAIAAIGTLDRELLLVLENARLVPDTVWDELDRRREQSA